MYGLYNPKGSQREALKVFSLPAVAQCLKYTGGKLFVALDSGSVLIFQRSQGDFLISQNSFFFVCLFVFELT